LKLFSELFRRLGVAWTVLLYGDMNNGNLLHLRALKAELEFIATHKDDMSKDEIVLLIVGDLEKANTGMLHHIAHALNSQNWRVVAAALREAELLDAKRRVREFLEELRG
jgi:hypothetical protein